MRERKHANSRLLRLEGLNECQYSIYHVSNRCPSPLNRKDKSSLEKSKRLFMEHKSSFALPKQNSSGRASEPAS